MKGLVFAVAVALACCVTTCGANARKCFECNLAYSRQGCKNGTWPSVSCTNEQIYCLSTFTKVGRTQGWTSRCATPRDCYHGGWANGLLCDTVDPDDVSTCVYCCDTDNCVGETLADTSAAVSAARVSVVAMTTATLAVLFKNAAGF